jgi:peptidoglycan hydrolase-like protein with peptidoglycan-binding domain
MRPAFQAGKENIMNRNLLVGCLVVIVFAFACNMPAGLLPVPADLAPAPGLQTPTVSVPEAAGSTATAAVPASPTATLTQTPTQAPTSTATNTPIPCNVVEFVADVTIPDNTAVGLNNDFMKVWKLRNAGSCSWTADYKIVFDSGDQMGAPASGQFTNETIDPGETVDIHAILTAPSQPGTYTGYWKLQEPGGATFGLSSGPFWVRINAVAVAIQQNQWPLVRQGDTGPVVRAVQYLLLAHGENLQVDGIFGPITKARVQSFQHDHGLHVDGIVGPETWPQLIIQVNQGDHGPAVRAVQVILKQKIGVGLDVDGIFGPQTRAAVMSFQNYWGLAKDGIVGPNTWRQLVDPEVGLYDQ